MIDAETLKLAARAASLTPVRMSDDGRGLLVAEQAEPWCPHTDIVEAVRLALHMNIDVRHYTGKLVASSDKHLAWGVERHDGAPPDKVRAYCEAVTICAAEVGKWMREKGAAA